MAEQYAKDEICNECGHAFIEHGEYAGENGESIGYCQRQFCDCEQFKPIIFVSDIEQMKKDLDKECECGCKMLLHKRDQGTGRIGHCVARGCKCMKFKLKEDTKEKEIFRDAMYYNADYCAGIIKRIAMVYGSEYVYGTPDMNGNGRMFFKIDQRGGFEVVDPLRPQSRMYYPSGAHIEYYVGKQLHNTWLKVKTHVEAFEEVAKEVSDITKRIVGLMTV